jgi:GrpB-like predicted nucleotidyltransferase (UPF0157 family)
MAETPLRTRNHDVIVLYTHAPEWASQFARQASLISAALGDVLLTVHHIGSTAIPPIAAKPVIDILAVVTSTSALDAVSSRLLALGYEAKGEFGIPTRRYFRKDTAEGVRTHQLHAFAVGSPDIDRHLNFRDYLRAHPAEAQAYALLKQRLAAQSLDGHTNYTDGKSDFIRAIDARASRWREGLGRS